MGKQAQIARPTHARLIPGRSQAARIIICRECRRSKTPISSAKAPGPYETVGRNRQHVQLGLCSHDQKSSGLGQKRTFRCGSGIASQL